MNLIKTTVFRLSLRFAAVFVLIFSVAIISVYYTTYTEIEEQTDLELMLEMGALETTHDINNTRKLIDMVNERERYGEHLGHLYTLLDKDKRYIAGDKKLASLMQNVSSNNNGIVYIERDTGDDEHTVLRIAYKQLDSHILLVIAQKSASLYELKEHTFSAIIIAVSIILLLGLIIGIYMGRVVLRRINLISEGMDQAIEENFKQMIDVPKTDDEFQSLTLKLNSMLHRIEQLVSGMRQVTDNIAHDLRSPLSRMRSRLEVTLLQSRTEKEYQEVMVQAVEDCDELLNTFNALLSIAQAEAGVRGNGWKAINLGDLLAQLAELYEVVAEDKGQSFRFSLSESVEVFGNRSLLTQALSNLIENAIKYTPAGGEILIKASRVNGQTVISVMDTGPGILKQDREKVLERFYRLDNARSSSGNGLGLSLVKAVATLHGATLILKDNEPGLKVELAFK